MPLFLAVKGGIGRGDSRVGIWFLLLALSVSLVLGTFRGEARRVLLTLALFFATLILAIAMNSVAGGGPSVYSAGAAVLVCLAWCSPIVSAYGLVGNGDSALVARRLLDTCSLAMTFSVYAGALGHFVIDSKFGEVIDRPDEVRIFGPLGDNVAFVIAMFTIRNLAHRRWIAVSMGLGAIALTATRGALIVAVTGGLVLVVLRTEAGERRGRTLRRALLAGAWAVVAAVAILGSPLGQTALQRSFDKERLREGARTRSDVMSLALAVAVDHPFLGIGFLGFRTLGARYAFSEHLDSTADFERATYSAQNQILQTATDAGVVGVFVLALFLGRLFAFLNRRRMRAKGRRRTELDGLMAALLALVIGNQSSVWILPESLTGFAFFLLAGLALRWSEGAASPNAGRRVALRPSAWNPLAPGSSHARHTAEG